MTRHVPLVEPLWRDLRHAARSVKRTPGFTAVAVATLALCLGANLTIFAVVDAVLLRPLPFPGSDRLVTVFNDFPNAGIVHDGASVTSYYEWRGRLPAFTSISAYRYGTAIVGEAGTTERRDVMRVTPDFFTTLGVGLEMGRPFTDADMTPRADDVAIVTDEYWRRHIGADSGVPGRTLRVDGIPRTIVGVLPSGFRFLSSDAQIYLPLASSPEERGVNSRYVSGSDVVGRLKAGAPLAEAQAEIDAHYAAHRSEFPWARQIEDAGFRVTAASLGADHVASIRPTLLLLQAGALLLLVMGGVNLVNLLLVRASTRTRELAIRRSLGASRVDLARHALVETILLAFLGGAAALPVGAAGIRLLDFVGVDRLPLGAGITLDAGLALVSLVAAVAVGAAIAAPVAWFELRGDTRSALASQSRGATASPAAERLRHGFVVAQIALAFALLAGAGLLGISLERALAVSPGFRPDHVLAGRITLSPRAYARSADRLAFAGRLLDALSHEPGIQAAGVITDVPVNGPGENNAMTVVGHTPEPGVSPILHSRYGVTGDYFAAMGIPLIAGRFLQSADSAGGPRVCVVDEDFARHYWPGGSALGQRVFEGPPQGRRPDEAFAIVGVVGAVKQRDVTEPGHGAIYFPYRDNASTTVFVVARTGLEPDAAGPALRRTARGVDPEMPVDDLRSMDVRIADSLIARRSPALLAGLFAAVALLLAAIGTYGVLSFVVARRRREIGVRIALGARPAQIGGPLLFLGLRLLAAGTIAGVAGAWMTGRAMQSVLFDVPALPVAILAGTAGIVGVVALAACLVPSLRAMRVPPVEALSAE